MPLWLDALTTSCASGVLGTFSGTLLLWPRHGVRLASGVADGDGLAPACLPTGTPDAALHVWRHDELGVLPICQAIFPPAECLMRS
jgi:hypothetical protein